MRPPSSGRHSWQIYTDYQRYLPNSATPQPVLPWLPTGPRPVSVCAHELIPTRMSETKLLSQLAYANHRKQLSLPGATHAAVAKAIKSGRLSRCLHQEGGKVLIDPKVADKEWAANTNVVMQRGEESVVTQDESSPRKSSASKSQAPATSHKPSESRIELDDLGIMKTKGDSSLADAISMADARAMKERYLALMAKLEYEMESGKLIEAEDARRAAFAAARKARDMLLTMADRLAPVVAGLADQFQCHKAITAEVRRVCDELSTNPLDKPAEASNEDGALDQ